MGAPDRIFASMARFFHPLLRTLASASHRQLSTQIQYLKTENEILRAKLPKRISITPAERKRLVKLGKKVGPAIKELITIVSPRTFRRWVAKSEGVAKPRSATAQPGRPRVEEDIRELVLRLAGETGWGYTRILGELKKLGVHRVSRSTVRNILIEAGFDPGPSRGRGSWDEFLKVHAQTLWACDFLSTKIWTRCGLMDYFVLFFIHIQTRRVIATPATADPDGQWTAQQARNFLMQVEEQGLEATHLIRDMDSKFQGGFDQVLETDGAQVVPVGPRKPNLNAYAERFALTIQQEALDHFVVLGEKHLNYLISEYLHHYHLERPHQGIGNQRIVASAPSSRPPPTGEVVCHQRLGGLLKHYQRRAA